jgi:hypothetical protein
MVNDEQIIGYKQQKKNDKTNLYQKKQDIITLTFNDCI